jgi:hypothetical protein
MLVHDMTSASATNATKRRERDEEHQGKPSTEPIGDPTARILIHAVEKVFRRSKQADRGNRSTERLKVLRQKATPEILSAPEQEHAR